MVDIRELSNSDLQYWLQDNNIPIYRSKQIYNWLWKRNANSFDEMMNLPKNLQDILKRHFSLKKIRIDRKDQSKDKSIKYIFRLCDDLFVEGVIIPAKSRITACISSQVGCGLGCKFCATGSLGLERNLSAAEIFDQVAILNMEACNLFLKPLTNIVVMGMGEPLQNYHNVMTALEHICSPEGMGISTRRITISTAGVVKMIRKLALEKVPYRLAVSLHSAIDSKRCKLMPVGVNNNIAKLTGALAFYQNKLDKKITFEYLLLNGINDSDEDAEALIKLCRQLFCKVNIIDFNFVDGLKYNRPSEQKIIAFIHKLETAKIQVTRRRSKGDDIGAACGQLSLQYKY